MLFGCYYVHFGVFLFIVHSFSPLFRFLTSCSALARLAALFALWGAEKHLGVLFEGGFILPEQSRLLKRAVANLCTSIKPDTIALVDAIAPADHVLASPIGQSNGEAYKNLYNAMLTTPKGADKYGVFVCVLTWKNSAGAPVVVDRVP